MAENWSGKRDSNPQPSAWKADALPIELFPLTPVVTNTPLGGISYSAAYRKYVVVGGGFEPPKAYADRFTVCSLWPLGNPTIKKFHMELAMGLEPATS